ncbi:MAG: sugar phosphate nucleotidyltransferase [Gaiellaceae bacterium]
MSEAPGLYDELAERGTKIDSAVRAVILAGGRGTRLAPYTSILPKPLMPIGDRAILELVVDRLAACGITDITVSVGHLAHLIRAVFDNGAHRGVNIEYVHEDVELGTAGPLRLVDGLDETFLVTNGDVLTTLDYGALVESHREAGNIMTIAAHRRVVKLDYGVLHVADGQPASTVTGFDEKPELSELVSMGVYVLEPDVLELIPKGARFDVPELVRDLLSRNLRVGTLLHPGVWFDIGRHEDYEAAVQTWLASPQGAGTTHRDALTGARPLERPANGALPA